MTSSFPALTRPPRPALADWARSAHAARLDLLVVGGGATGLGVALQAALEGRQVAVVEANDFASGTSSRSTKLLHGGVRYLAQGRLGLVREALRERTTVMRLAPHLAQPLAFSVRTSGPIERAVMALGLKFYEGLAGDHRIGRVHATAGGLRYWDGQFEDARLALALARSAERTGALLRNHTRVTGLRPRAGGWEVTLTDALDGARASVHARTVVNATGVWVDVLRQAALAPGGPPVPPLVRTSQGIHLVVPRERLPLHEAVLVPRTTDGRVLFALPWLGATVIGTTDTARDDAPAEPRPLAQEVAFLLRETQRTLGVTLRREDIRSTWAGLRPLVMAPSQGAAATRTISREHLVRREAPGLFTLTGGKWTTYRVMAADLLAQMHASGDLPAPSPVARDVATSPLVGAPPKGADATSLREPPGLHLYGSEAAAVRALPGADRPLGAGLTEAMVRFAARQEWAVTVEDMLARRWRVLFLDAREAARMAPAVARLLQEETGIDPRLQAFLGLCRQYLPPPDWDLEAMRRGTSP